MPRVAHPLTDLRIRQAAPRARAYTLFDGLGLYLAVTPAGGKLWRLKYRYAGRECRLSLGAWPAVSLAAARRRREEVRALLAQGQDPRAVRRAERARQQHQAAHTLAACVREWAARHLAARSPSHRAGVLRRLERWVLPALGARPVADVTPLDVLAVLRRIADAGKLETAHRVRQALGQVCRYAVVTGRAASDPTAALRGALPPTTPTHMPAPTDPATVGALLRMLEAVRGTPEVCAAVRVLPYVFVRPGELRRMRWADVDLDAGEWRYTTSKTRTPHLVPLARQVVARLRALWPLTGHLPGGWVFPNARSPLRPMSDMAINAAYRRLGIDTRRELTGHGWRAVARTLLHERLGVPADVIEHQLAHAVPDALGTAYNRTRFLDHRRAMMQHWADYLDRLREDRPAEIVPLRRASEWGRP